MRRQVATVILCVGLVSCGADRPPVTSVYDAATRELIRLDADTDRDGTIDARTYLRATTVLRTEVDTNGDGRVDRWEYVAGTQIARVGSSSLGDGVEDTWTLAASSGGEVIVDRALGGDRRPVRRETYRDDTLLRAEEDSNADGLTDKWEAFEGGRLRAVSFDTSGRAGLPDRRVVYDAAGQFDYLEVDEKRDGVFVRK